MRPPAHHIHGPHFTGPSHLDQMEKYRSFLKHPDVNDLRGRGLVIVKEPADERGAVRRAGRAGKTVWSAMRGA